MKASRKMSIEKIQTASTNSIPDTPPSAEPERQYYYMEKAKQHLARPDVS